MLFEETPIAGAYIVGMQPHEDERGFFARGWCAREFAEHGLEAQIAQVNVSFNRRKHTLRGMHYQAAPHEEAKLLRCVRGAVHLALVDLRPGSASHLRHFAVTLSGENLRMLYLPKGCANGFLTLADDSELLYLMSGFHTPGFERGLRWNDPALGITWPAEPLLISERDRNWPDFSAEPKRNELG